jgi:hypothetical protein
MFHSFLFFAVFNAAPNVTSTSCFTSRSTFAVGADDPIVRLFDLRAPVTSSLVSAAQSSDVCMNINIHRVVADLTRVDMCYSLGSVAQQDFSQTQAHPRPCACEVA